MDIGQAEVATRMAKRQTLMIEPQKMQHGRVQVVCVHGILRGHNPVLIGLAENDPPFDTASGHPR